MRKFKPVFLLLALLTGAAFAAEVGVSSRASSSGDDVARAATTRTTANRVTASRNVPNATNASSGNSVTTRTTVSRATVNRGTAANSNTTRSTVSRSNVSGASRGTVSRASTNQTKTANTTRNVSGDINANPAVRRAGVTLRPSFADYGGRATIAGTGTMTGSNIRSDIQKLSGRAAKNVTATAESIVGTRETLERTSELNKSCQEQYNECMDQFCAVIDANQKRCSCSSNLSRYTKVEKAVTDANNKLNEVAQTIRYVGLSADEIRAIMSETEAEEALRDSKDNSATRNMLKQIESMIKDPTSRTNNYVSEMDFGLDMDLTFSSDPVDIFNLDFLNLGTNSSTISNLRGTELYRTAKKRCNTILTRCKEAGATQDQIVGNYDLAIDKDCIEYEAGLTKMNETLLANVKSANLMLQKARLAVNQNQNQYDALGCVAALENCMKDDMVCGDDYLQCVDPTKAYIDENGEVVMGQDITVIQSFMTDYNNAVLDKSYLQSAYNTRIGVNSCGADGKCVVKYLLQKIGTKQKTVDEGLCRAVLDRCQNYTYDKDKKYKPYNDIVINYLQRAMVSIKAAQQRIISDYASNCITDVAACYSQQVSQISGLTTAASKTDVKSVMRGACRSIALTCGFAIFTGKPEIDPNKVLESDGGKLYNVSDCKYITNADPVPSYGSSTYNNAIINCVSDMFYDSLLSSLDSSSSSSNNSGNNGTTNTTYTVTYTCGDGNGSAWTSSNVTSVILPGDPTTDGRCTAPAGKAFGGWNVNGTTTNAGTSITVSGNMTISAVWVDGTYTLTYSCGEGTPTGDAIWTVQNAPAQYTLPADPTGNQCNAPVGKTFGGWLVGANETPVAANTPVTITVNTNITAKWGNGEYTYSYDCNNNGAGGDAPTAPNEGKVTYGQSVILAENADTCTPPSGKKFGGWLDNSNSVKTGTISWNYTENQLFKVNWIDLGRYTVIYDSNIPSGTKGTFNGEEMAASEHQFGVEKALTTNKYAITGYEFKGWTKDQGGAGTLYTDGQTVKNLVENENVPSVKLYAKWEAKKYVANYTCGKVNNTTVSGTTNPTSEANIVFDSNWTPTASVSGCTKPDGYNFANQWRVGDTDEIIGATNSTKWGWAPTNTTTVTFNAVWVKDGINCQEGTEAYEATCEQTPFNAGNDINGCVRYGCRCIGDRVPGTNGCVDPCSDLGDTANIVNKSTCGGFNASSNCAKQYCQCKNGYQVNSNGQCIKKIKITYNCGTVSGSSVSGGWSEDKLLGERFNLPNAVDSNIIGHCTPSSGELFNGWKVGSGSTVYTAGTSMSYNEDTTLFAQWDKLLKVNLADDSHTQGVPGYVYLRYNNGWYSDENGQTPVSKIEPLPNKSGCTFEGFKSDNNVLVIDSGGNLLTTTQVLTFATTNQTVRAQWDCPPQQYTVPFRCGSNATGEEVSATITQGDSVTLSDPTNGMSLPGNKTFRCTPNTGYAFDKWQYVNQDYSSGDTVPVIGSYPFIVIWKYVGSGTEMFNVTFDCGEGTCIDNNWCKTTSIAKNTEVDIPTTLTSVCSAPNNKPYFGGWDIQVNGATYLHDEPITKLKIFGTTVIKAKWSEDDIGGDTPTTETYKITYNCNGGSGNISAQSVNIGAEATLTSSTCTRSGYNFAGWILSPDTNKNSGSVRASGYKFTPTGNVTATAQWTSSGTYRLVYSCGNYFEVGDMPFDVKDVTASSGKFTLGFNTYYKQIAGTSNPVQYETKYHCNGTDYGVFIGWQIGNDTTKIYLPGQEYTWNSSWTTYQEVKAVFSTVVQKNTSSCPNTSYSVSGTNVPGTSNNYVCFQKDYQFKCNTNSEWYNSWNKCLPKCGDGTRNTTCVDENNTGNQKTTLGISENGTPNGCATYYCKCSDDKVSQFVDGINVNSSSPAGSGYCEVGTPTTYTVTYDCGSYVKNGQTYYASRKAGTQAQYSCDANTPVYTKSIGDVCQTPDEMEFDKWTIDGQTVSGSVTCDGNITIEATWKAATVTYECGSDQVTNVDCGLSPDSWGTEGGCVSRGCACKDGYVVRNYGTNISPQAGCYKPCAGVSGETSVDSGCPGFWNNDESIDQSCAGLYCACSGGTAVNDNGAIRCDGDIGE